MVAAVPTHDQVRVMGGAPGTRLVKRVQGDAVKAMNETTLAQVVKRLKKA